MSSNRWFEDREWSLLEMTGADRADFLSRLSTNVLPKSESPLVHNFFLSVNARIEAEFWVSAQKEHLALLTPAAQAGALEACVDRYHFGEKIALSQAEGKLFVLRDAEPSVLELASRVFSPDPRYGPGCSWCFVASGQIEAFVSALGEEMSTQEAELLRIALGRLRFGLDYTEDSLFVEVAQQDDFSESKGCYPGQEIVARVLHRGRLKRHLRSFRSSQVLPENWEFKVDGKTMASVRSVVPTKDGGSVGYLMVRREYGETDQELTAQGEDGTEYTLTVVPRAGEVLTGEDDEA